MTYKNKDITRHSALFCLIFISLFLSPNVTDGAAHDMCRRPNGGVGICVLLSNCLPLLEINKKEFQSSEDVLFLKQSSCGFSSAFKPKVCCPPEEEWNNFHSNGTSIVKIPQPTYNPPNSGTKNVYISLTSYYPNNSYSHCGPTLKPPTVETQCCGVDSNTFKIYGGVTTGVDEHPWLALLEYENGGTECAGSLISSRYVLSAAHCLRSRYGEPKKIRLAEYNTSSYPIDRVLVDGGDNDIFEEIEVLICGIERLIPHPEYSHQNKQNDIGLIKMSTNAPYNDFIRPICLPSTDITWTAQYNMMLVVAGWGSNGKTFNEVKSQVQLPFVATEKCKNFYDVTDRQICAGGEIGKDSCNGDSGGPLMYSNGSAYILVGVVSYGPQVCGKKAKPAIYTNVYKYLDWITQETV